MIASKNLYKIFLLISVYMVVFMNVGAKEINEKKFVRIKFTVKKKNKNSRNFNFKFYNVFVFIGIRKCVKWLLTPRRFIFK